MLQQSKVFSSFSTDNLEAAKQFYGQTLGLSVKQEAEMGLGLHLDGGGEVFIYPKPNHEPATFTVLNFRVGNIDEAVDALIAKGITFEQYDTGYMKTDAKGISRSASPEHGPSIAWFKDPAGNLLSVVEEN